MARRPRASEICLDECQTYHVITRCTRQLHLLAGDEASPTGRKDFLLNQLERVATFTAVGVAGFSVMDNHLHLLLKGCTRRATVTGIASRSKTRTWTRYLKRQTTPTSRGCAKNSAPSPSS